MTVDRRAILAGGAALGASTLAAPAIAQQKIQWRMVTTWPKNAPGVGVNAQRLADRIGAMSGGRMAVELFAAGELVPPFEALDAVRQGVAELSHSASFFWIGKSEELNYFGSIPFGLTASEIAGWLYFGGGLGLWEETMAEFGIKPLFAGSSGISAGGWFRKEINSVADLQGLKFRIAGLGGEVMRRLGATTVVTPPGEVYTALERGVIDGYGWPLWGIQDLGWDKYTKFRHDPGFISAAVAVIVNLDKWKGLAEDQRQCLTKTAIWAEHEWPKWRAAEDAHQMATQQKAGIKAVDLGPRFAEQAEEAYWADLAKGDPEFVKKVRPLMSGK